MAELTGQHITTVRFHLDVLTRDSLVRTVQQPPKGRGRPRLGYSAVQRSVGYQDLAQVLADRLGPDPHRRLDASVTAGRAWGAKVDDTGRQVETLEDARAVTTALSADLGFAPVNGGPVADADGSTTIKLTACPLRELARTHSDVVCGVHLGMLREVLDRSGTPGAFTASLHPFAESDACYARIGAAGAHEVTDLEARTSA